MPKTHTPPAGQVRDIELAKIHPHPLNPRESTDGIDVERLAQSIDASGLLQRVIVRHWGDGYQLVAGARRLEAAKRAGWRSIPCEVRDLSDAASVRVLVDENLFRKGLNPIEKAKALQLLQTPASEGGAGLKTTAIAARFGKSESAIQKQLRLLKLPDPWRGWVAKGDIDAQTGIAISAHVKHEPLMAALKVDRTANPDKWQGQANARARVKLIAEKFGKLTQATKRRQRLAENKPAKIKGQTATGAVAIAEHFDVSESAVRKWKRQGAPIDFGQPADLAAIAKWQHDREAAAVKANSKPARRAPPRQDVRHSPPKRGLLSYGDVVAVIAPYANSKADLLLFKEHVDSLLEELKA